MNPPRFPTSETDLDAWSVYADWLQTHGDPLGERIALELAMPADASDLRPFHAAIPSSEARFVWALGYARVLAVTGRDLERVDRALDLLGHPRGQIVEELRFDVLREHDPARMWPVLAKLPPTCARVEIHIHPRSKPVSITEFVDRIPPTVRELAFLGEELTSEMQDALIDDRFDIVELLRLHPSVSPTSRVRVHRADAVTLARPRVELGGPDDGAVVDPSRGIALALGRWPLLEHQARRGPIPIRAQIARRVPESYRIREDRVDRGGTDLVRRGNAWFAADTELTDGAWLRAADQNWMLVARDVTATTRAHLT